MPTVEKLLRSCLKSRSSAHTKRKLIGFKQRAHCEKCMKHLAKHGIEPLARIGSGKAIACHIDTRNRAKIKSIAGHPDVQYVEPDYKMRAHGFIPKRGSRKGMARKRLRIANAVRSQHRSRSVGNRAAGKCSERGVPFDPKVTWNIKQVQAPLVWPATLGRGAGIAIIDTGIGKHPDLCVSGGVNTMGGRSFADDNGHGTHVAGIAAALGKKGMIAGVAPRAKLYAVKALDASGSGYVSAIVKGIDWCIKKRIPVINMSLGFSGPTSFALRDAVRRARKHGVVVVASAGNDGPANKNGIDQPASYPESIAVAAANRNRKIAYYSSRGKGIGVAAPGTNILSTYPGGRYAIESGTSMSSPHVAGGAALLKSLKPTLTPGDIGRRLRGTACKVPGYGVRAQGCGLIRLFVAAAKPCKPRKR